jgi:hypothetical protein
VASLCRHHFGPSTCPDRKCKISDLVWSFGVPNCSAAKENIERTVCYHFATQLLGTNRYGKRYRGSEV